MPMIDPQEQNSAYEAVYAVGPVAQAIPVMGSQPSTIAAGSSWTSGLMNGDGFKVIAAAATSSQPGQMQITRFLDGAGIVAMAGGTVSLTAGASASIVLSDGVPYRMFAITITNTGTSLATITNFAALLNAA